MKFVITTIIMLLMVTPALGETINPVNSFLIIEDFPDNITAGSQYQIIYNFSLAYNVDVAMNFSISHPGIEDDEWNVSYILNGETIIPNETGPGIFSNETMMAIGDYELITTFESLPNIMPGTYEFKSWLTYDGIEVASVKKKSGGGRRYYPTPTSTPEPVNATPEPTQTAVVDDETNASDDNVSEAPQEPDEKIGYLSGLLGITAVFILIYLYSLHKKQG